MFIAALFVITKEWKQLRCPSTDERIDEAWLSVRGVSFSLGRDEVLIQAAALVNCENCLSDSQLGSGQGLCCVDRSVWESCCLNSIVF